MKWLAFTAGCAVALILLGILAVDERDVLWEGYRPLCPYCRSDMPQYALVCKECDRTVDWVPQRISCRTCLNAEDVKHLKDGFDALRLQEGEPLPIELAGFARAYFLAMEAGNCTYCAGLKKIMDDGVEVECPICRGYGKCVACSGDGDVVLGDLGAHRRLLAREQLWEEERRREELTRLTLLRSKLVSEDVVALRGYAEAEELTDESGRDLLQRARTRVKQAFTAIQAAVAERTRPAIAADAPRGS